MRTLMYSVLIALLFVMSGCVMVPPEHHYHGRSRDYEYREKYRYRYYPECGIYFDLERRLYFYRDHGWRASSSLPRYIHLEGMPVIIDLYDDEPYAYYNEHREKYPPRSHR